jgi:predicted kinase
MEKQILFILCGEAFSGKSTLARKIAELYKAKLVGRDEVYFSVEKLLALEDTPENDDDSLWENLWPIAIQGAKNHLLLGDSVVFDDNCLHLRQRDELRSIAKEIGVKSILIYLDIPTEVLRERKEKNKISKARHDVPSAWLGEDSQNFERPTEIEKPITYRSNDTLEELISRLGILSKLFEHRPLPCTIYRH